METIILPQLLQQLEQLLDDDLSPHYITYQFQNIACMLIKECVRLENINCREYYDDEELSVILLMKDEALANGQFDQASKFRFIEKELLLEKGETEFTRLKTESAYFENNGRVISFHFNRLNQNQRLIANLIEGYNLVNGKFNYNGCLPGSTGTKMFFKPL